MQEIQLFPGLGGAVIKRLCDELGIKRKKMLLAGAKSTYVLTRRQFESLMVKAGWELVKLDKKKYWVKFKIEDF